MILEECRGLLLFLLRYLPWFFVRTGWLAAFWDGLLLLLRDGLWLRRFRLVELQTLVSNKCILGPLPLKLRRWWVPDVWIFLDFRFRLYSLVEDNMVVFLWWVAVLMSRKNRSLSMPRIFLLVVRYEVELEWQQAAEVGSHVGYLSLHLLLRHSRLLLRSRYCHWFLHRLYLLRGSGDACSCLFNLLLRLVLWLWVGQRRPC